MKKPICCLLLFSAISFSVSAQLPSGYVGYYLLNNSATDYSGNNYNGTLTSTSATTNRFGTSNKATLFTSGTSTGTLPLGLVTALQNNFSIGYWFKTSMTANSSSQWYGGNAIVDAEVCGVTTDWGTALIDGGKVCFGIGAPDITIKTTATTYNDGNWHFVTAVRDKTAGSITLYVDGAQKATTTGTNTGTLNAPSFIGLGRNPCNSSAVFTGSLDDLIAYNRVLSSTEVSNLYNFLNASPLPLYWISFIGEINNNNIKLKWEVEKIVNNDHFEVEHSTDGINFSVISSVPDNAGIANGSKTDYSFIHTSPSNGNHFYRIKQIDIDGKYSYSTTIRLTVHNSFIGLSLKSNPVHDELVIINQNQQLMRQLIIMDISGRILRKQEINSNATSAELDVRSLPSGYYLLKVKGIASDLMTSPFIKQ